VAADAVEGLVKGVPGSLGVAIRPQIQEKPVARDPRIAAAGQDSEEGQCPRAGGWPFDRF
jgi:hypothetical protein